MPWYIWLSLFGLLYISCDTQHRIIELRNKAHTYDEWKALDKLWDKSCLASGFIIFCWFMLMMAFMLTLPANLINEYLPLLSLTIPIAVPYFTSVFAAYRYAVWSKKALPAAAQGIPNFATVWRNKALSDKKEDT